MPNEKEKPKEYVLKTTRDKDVKSISLWFTDILGFLKSFDITPRELEAVLADGAFVLHFPDIAYFHGAAALGAADGTFFFDTPCFSGRWLIRML